MKVFLFVVLFCFCSVGFSQEGRVSTYTSYNLNSSAQGVAQIQASRNSMGHCGGNRGQYEGVGYSSSSSEAAIKRCCYWGQRTPVDIGVARGKNGWYACVRYR